MKYLASLFFIFFCLVSFSQDIEETTLVKMGDLAPKFSFIDENGNTVSSESLKGKVIMVNLFATWCGPCLKELPHVQTEIFDKYKGNSKFKLLVFGREHTQKQLDAFKEKKGFTFPIIADPKRGVYKNFATNYIPRNFVIDSDGVIIYSSVGFNDKDFEELKKVLARQLN